MSSDVDHDFKNQPKNPPEVKDKNKIPYFVLKGGSYINLKTLEKEIPKPFW